METSIDTLERAKRELRQNWESGIDCPCCGQNVKLYNRPLNSGQAWALIQLARLCYGNDQYYHYNDITGDRNITDFAQLRHWGLAEQAMNDDATKSSSGEWRITNRGYHFVIGVITIPAYLQIFNKRVRGESRQQVTIVEALGKNFNYPELMGWLI